MFDTSNENNPLTKKNFMDWLENKSGHYNYNDHHDCAIAQYLKDQFPDAEINVGGFDFYINSDLYRIPENITHILYQVDSFEQLREKLKDIDF